MKKYVFTVILIAFQFLFPNESLADNISIEENTNNSLEYSSSISDSSYYGEETSYSTTPTIDTESDGSVGSSNIEATNESLLKISGNVESSDDASIGANKPLVVSISVEKLPGVQLANTSITLSGFDENYVDLTKTKLTNGSIENTFGTLSFDLTTQTIIFTFNDKVEIDDEGTLSFKIYIYGKDLDTDSPMQTLVGEYTDSSGEKSSIPITDPNYYVSKKDDTSQTENRIQAVGVNLYSDAGGALIDNFVSGDKNREFGGVSYNGIEYYPEDQYIASNNVLDPGDIGKYDTDRKFIFTVDQDAEIIFDKIFVSKNGDYFKLDSSKFAEYGSYVLSEDHKTLTLSFKDEAKINWLVINMNTYTPSTEKPYKFYWKYEGNHLSGIEEYREEEHTDYRFFVQGDISGFVPRIIAPNKNISTNDMIDDTDAWLREEVTAKDVEDGDLSPKVTVKDDGGFSEGWNNKQPGPYEVEYQVTDSSGNNVVKKVTVTVYSDVIIHFEDDQGNTLKEDVVLSGEPGGHFTIDTSDIEVDSNIYEFISADSSIREGTFGSTGQLTEITLYFAKSKQSISGSDFTMYLGDPQPTVEDFKGKATDKSGNPSEVSADLTTVDFTKVGAYDVVLTAATGQTKTVKLFIKNDNQSISGSDFTMYLGDPQPTVEDFEGKATDKYDNAIEVSADLTAVDFTKIGTYDVILISADGQTKTVRLFIKDTKQSISGSDFTMYLGDPQPTVEDFKGKATDKSGNTIEVSADLTAVDFTKVGTYDVVLTAADGQTKTVKLFIKDKAESDGSSDHGSGGDSSSGSSTDNSKDTSVNSITRDNVTTLTNESATSDKNSERKNTLPQTSENQSITLFSVGIIIFLLSVKLYLDIKNKNRA